MTTMIVNIPEKEKSFFLALFKKFHLKSKVLSTDDKEDIWFAKMIDEAEREGGEVSEQEILKLLKRNGAKI
ncbi:MAG: hypothetical protein HYU69_00060 [Bacteroidetes bacterium]|nr:hypothetical protein [Bacteroidota bacterium]MBL7893135.1 hypothetical protein [Bacteroidia bacterium]